MNINICAQEAAEDTYVAGDDLCTDVEGRSMGLRLSTRGAEVMGVWLARGTGDDEAGTSACSGRSCGAGEGAIAMAVLMMVGESSQRISTRRSGKDVNQGGAERMSDQSGNMP